MTEQQNVAGEQHTKARLDRKYLYAAVVLIIILVVVVLIATQSSGEQASLASYDNVLVPAALVSQLNVPANISNQIGIGTATYRCGNGVGVCQLQNKSLTIVDGKPLIFYLGAEYCPFCAAERWAMVIALSRFGTFSNLHFMTAGATDPAGPGAPTFTFYNSSYTSPYVSFVSVEETTNQPQGNGYAPLQQPNQSELALAEAYDPYGSIPFIFFANKSVVDGANFEPLGVLNTQNWSTITAEMYNTSTLQSQSIVGSADLITEQICDITNNMPASVCTQPYISKVRSVVK